MNLCPRSIAIYISTMVVVIEAIIFLPGSTDLWIDDSIDITVILQALVRRSLDVIRLNRSLVRLSAIVLKHLATSAGSLTAPLR